MSEIGDTFSAYKRMRKEKKEVNREYSIERLKAAGISFETKNFGVHLIVGDFNFWPSTGKFQNRTTKKTGRGLLKLIALLEVAK